MTDSKRIDQHIQNQKNVRGSHTLSLAFTDATPFLHPQSLMHPTIISRHFWPPLQTNTFIMPGQFKEIQEGYAKEFIVFKPDKKLVWMSHLGSISLDVELDDRTISAEVPPLEAAFVELFSEQGQCAVDHCTLTILIYDLTIEQWTVAELMEKVGLTDTVVATKALVTWVDLGVLREEEPGQYILLKTADPLGSTSKNTGKAPAAAVEDLPPVVTVQQQQAEQMRVFWKVIVLVLLLRPPLILF